jgi:M6 family metalloprotease-like protein
LCCVALIATATLHAADSHPSRQCGTSFTLPGPRIARTLDESGGRHLTAQGTLRVLIVFVSFPDDSTPHANWPARQKPSYIDQFIDPDTLTRSQNPFNLTFYFDQMSLGRFHFIGEAIWVETSESQERYRASGAYGRANWIVLQEKVDPIVDFSRYDNWTNVSDHTNMNKPDGQVDMIIMVWRTTMYEYLGEASLGYRGTMMVDGVRIETGFPDYYPMQRGSGVTCEYPYGDDPVKAMRTMAHEVGHWLLGGLHPYNGYKPDGKFQFWGILCPGQRASSCANSYDREQLGWITVPELPPDSNVSLRDFLTTGEAFKYHPTGGEAHEYFYIENHQKLSPLDDITSNPDDKGIWILHQQGPYLEEDNLRIKPSDGYWKWNYAGASSTCYGQLLPVYARGTPDLQQGYSHRDQIPTPASTVDWMYVFRDGQGEIHCGNFLAGEGFTGSFTPQAHNVFSAYSNPGSDSWNHAKGAFALEVVSSTQGTMTIRSFSDSLGLPPAARYLGLNPTRTGATTGHLDLAWGTQWPSGQRIEPDIIEGTLERRVGDQGTWTAVYQGPSTAWTDSSRTYNSSGSVPVSFRARVRNSRGKYSSWSNEFQTTAVALTEVGVAPEDEGRVPPAFRLEQNYPNPFNPRTRINFAIGDWSGGMGVDHGSHVTLRVYDILGREVALLVDDEKASGMYSVTMDAKGLSSGVYLYRLNAGNYMAARKMVIAK